MDLAVGGGVCGDSRSGRACWEENLAAASAGVLWQWLIGRVTLNSLPSHHVTSVCPDTGAGMSNPVDSAETRGLQLQSLELDMKTLQRYREEDRKEFKDFQTLVTRNFVTMQKIFDKIQESFKLLLIDPEQEEVLDEHSAHGSVQPKQHQTRCVVIQPDD
ncbi:hypothetical protein D1007_11042 [Hordeum vulgare]|nr:hypothetical protein D1007_11042 [Hordeum vulgare]